MSPATQSAYFALWNQVCRRQGWKASDSATRRGITVRCMELVGAPLVSSVTELNAHQWTALFTYLRHLADPDALDPMGEWEQCREDYRSFNQVRQARHKTRRAGYSHGGRLDSDRFQGGLSAAFPTALPGKKVVGQMLATAGARLYRKEWIDQVRAETGCDQAEAVAQWKAHCAELRRLKALKGKVKKSKPAPDLVAADRRPF